MRIAGGIAVAMFLAGIVIVALALADVNRLAACGVVMTAFGAVAAVLAIWFEE